MMKTLVACLLSLILTALFFASLLVLSERPSVRYSGPWPYQTNFAALYADSGPVDIVIGGSSRSRRGIRAEALARDLASVYAGREPVIYNLSLAGRGFDAHVIPLLEFLETREAGVIFLQYDDATKKGIQTHRNLSQIGRLSDILFTPIESFPAWEVLTHRAQLLYRRIGRTADFCVVSPSLCSAELPQRSPAVIRSGTRPRNTIITLLKRRLKRRKNRDGYFVSEPRSWDPDSSANHRNSFYLDMLAEKAKAKGIQVVVMDFPKFEFPELAAGFEEEIEARFGVSYLAFSRDELLDLADSGYGDQGHFNFIGERMVRRKLVDYLKENVSP